MPEEPGKIALYGDVWSSSRALISADRAGRFVDLAALDPHKAVLDDVQSAHALGAGARDSTPRWPAAWSPGRHRSHGSACLKVMMTSSGSLVVVRGCGVGVDVLDRPIPDVLKEPGLDGATPDVLVNGVRRLLGDVNGQSVLLGELDRHVTRQAVVADGRDAVNPGARLLIPTSKRT